MSDITPLGIQGCSTQQITLEFQGRQLTAKLLSRGRALCKRARAVRCLTAHSSFFVALSSAGEQRKRRTTTPSSSCLHHLELAELRVAAALAASHAVHPRSPSSSGTVPRDLHQAEVLPRTLLALLRGVGCFCTRRAAVRFLPLLREQLLAAPVTARRR